MKANELKRKYIDYFVNKGHTEIQSASLIPENDPSVLFTTAGMHPLAPYLLGEKHPAGKRLVDCQKCIRTGDIDEVGDASHLTMFQMMGNWSLGDYFKKESIQMSYDFLVNVLGIDPNNLAVTAFAGDENAPRDEETVSIWKSMGMKDDHIFYYGKKDNWWGPAGVTGPCGPDTEIFYIDQSKPKCSDECGPSCHCGRYLEIWNNVFMEYNKTVEGKYEKLKQQNVDTGLGLERTLCVLEHIPSVYDTEFFIPIIKDIENASGLKYADSIREFRIIADHMRAAVFILGDDKGVAPSNLDQGYVLRKLIRRTIRYMQKLGMGWEPMIDIANTVVREYSSEYPELERNKAFIIEQLQNEAVKFTKTLDQGLRLTERILEGIEQNGVVSGEDAFKLYTSFGFPLDLTIELAAEKGIKVDSAKFEELFKEHQEISRAGSMQKFKGGLADASEETTKLHTATHLLGAALRKVLGPDVHQKGSNITAERLRFDFSFDRKVTKEELDEVEKLVNEAIKSAIDVVCEEMTLGDARERHAEGVFGDKYGEMVKVYTIGDISCEICGGPHVVNTSQIGGFKIKKEEASSAGVRRIKAVVGDQYA